MGAASIMGAASMKKILLTTVALTALVATSAMAADVGVYGGTPAGLLPSAVTLAGLWAHKEWVDHEPFWAGCDYQFAGGFVVGVARATTPGAAPKTARPASCSPGPLSVQGEFAGVGDWPSRIRVGSFPRLSERYRGFRTTCNSPFPAQPVLHLLLAVRRDSAIL